MSRRVFGAVKFKKKKRQICGGQTPIHHLDEHNSHSFYCLCSVDMAEGCITQIFT